MDESKRSLQINFAASPATKARLERLKAQTRRNASVVLELLIERAQVVGPDLVLSGSVPEPKTDPPEAA
jgi:hypothetical protein